MVSEQEDQMEMSSFGKGEEKGGINFTWKYQSSVLCDSFCIEKLKINKWEANITYCEKFVFL